MTFTPRANGGERLAFSIERIAELELALRHIRSDCIGQPESTFVKRVRMYVDGVLGKDGGL